jgi:hypothetical protein
MVVGDEDSKSSQTVAFVVVPQCPLPQCPLPQALPILSRPAAPVDAGIELWGDPHDARNPSSE